MNNLCIGVCVVLWINLYYTKGITASSPKLYSPSSTAVLGKPYTLVCTWSDFGNNDNSHDVMDITWIRKDVPQFVFNSQTCNLTNTDNGSVDISAVSAESGYLYQSLTFTNITAHDTGYTWYCDIDQQSKMSNPVKITSSDKEAIMSSPSDVVYTDSNISLTCTFSNLGLATWIIGHKIYFILGKSRVIVLQDDSNDDERNIVKRSQIDVVPDSSQTLTLSNITLADHDVTWACSVEGKGSNIFRIIVLDPQDLPQNVTLKQLDTEDENTTVVICSTTCENEYHFSWDYDIPGHLSDMVYDSCKHVCSQTLTIYVEDSDKGKLVQCTVTNPRTGKTSEAQYQIVTHNEEGNDRLSTSSSLAENTGTPVYIWGSAAGGGVIVIVIIIVAVIVVARKRRASSKSSVPEPEIPPKPRPVMVDNVLYEQGGPELSGATVRESRIVMEDNVLYERRELASSEDDVRESKMVMEDNVLYEQGGQRQTEQHTRGSKTEDDILNEGCENRRQENVYHIIDPMETTEDS